MQREKRHREKISVFRYHTTILRFDPCRRLDFVPESRYSMPWFGSESTREGIKTMRGVIGRIGITIKSTARITIMGKWLHAKTTLNYIRDWGCYPPSPAQAPPIRKHPGGCCGAVSCHILPIFFSIRLGKHRRGPLPKSQEGVLAQ